MMNSRWLMFLSCVVAMIATPALGRCQQGESSRSTEDLRANQDEEEVEVRVDVEPGIVRYGKANRFAELGECFSFDTSPDGHTMVFASNQLKFFDLNDNRIVAETGASGELFRTVAYSANGLRVFAPTQIGSKWVVRVYDALDQGLIGTIPLSIESAEAPSPYPQEVVASADSKFLGVRSYNSVQVRRIESGELVLRRTDLGFVKSIGFSPDETELFVLARGKLIVIDLESGEEKSRSESKLVGLFGNWLTINISRNLMAITQTGKVALFDLEAHQPLGDIALPGGAMPVTVEFSDNGSLIAIEAVQQQKMLVMVADVEKKRVVFEAEMASGRVTRKRFSQDRKHLFVMFSGVNAIQELRIDGDSDGAGLDSNYPGGQVKSAVVQSDGSSFVAATFGKLTWFDAESGDVKRSLSRPSLKSLLLVKDESEMVAITGTTTLERLDSETGKVTKSYSVKHSRKPKFIDRVRAMLTDSSSSTSAGYQTQILDVKLSADESEFNCLVAESEYRWNSNSPSGVRTMEQKLGLQYLKFDAETGRRIWRRRFSLESIGFDKQNWIQLGAIHPEGTEFAVASQNRVTVVDTESGEVIRGQTDRSKSGAVERVSGSPMVVTLVISNFSGIQYSPDGRVLVAAGRQKGVWVWDVDSGRELKFLDDVGGSSLLAFSNDGSRMACCSRRKEMRIRVFDTKTWKDVIPQKTTPSNRTAIALSNNGQRLFVGLADCRMELWDLDEIQKTPSQSGRDRPGSR